MSGARHTAEQAGPASTNLALDVLLAIGLATNLTGARLVIARSILTRSVADRCETAGREDPLGGELHSAMRIEIEDSDQWAARGSDSMAP